MKNSLVFIFTICALFAASVVSAQITIGPRAGIILADQSSDIDDYDPESVAALQAGLFLNVPIGDVEDGGFAIQPELMYVQRSYDVEFAGTDVATFRYNYIDIPIMLQYNFIGEGMGFFLQAGPYVGIALDGSYQLGDSDKVDIDFDDSNYNSTDIGAQIGAGAGIYLGEGMLFIDARYLLGFSNTYDGDDSDDIKVNNRGLGLTAGFRIPL